MTKIVTTEEMRSIETAADAAGVSYDTLMENAGRAVAEVVKSLLPAQTEGSRVAVLVGHGNNGGDGLVAARILKQETGAEVGCYLARPRPDDPNFVAAQDAGVFIATVGDDQHWRVLRNLVGNADVLVDALLGTGARLPISGDLKKLITEAAGALARTRPPEGHGEALIWPASPRAASAQGTHVVAVDCPSGLDCDTGDLDPTAMRADVTVTFAAAKHGQLRFPGADSTGELVISPIGIPDDLPELHAVVPELATAEYAAGLLPQRSHDSHKGSYGRVMIVAGSVNYSGAPVLAASAAYRAGAGLVRLAVPQAIYPVVGPQIPEAIWSLLPHEMGAIRSTAVDVVVNDLEGIGCILVGPGLGQDDETADFIRGLLASDHRTKRGRIGFGHSPDAQPDGASGGLTIPLVIDADGLNLLAAIDEWPNLLPPGTILTPHLGEMVRLSGMDRADIQADRVAIARDRAAAWNCVLVLKGAYTVVAGPDGRVVVNPFATDALATAGTGDVLAGCIVGMLAQGVLPFEAAVLSAYLHGLAGTLAGEQATARSTMASDVLNELPAALRRLEALTEVP